MYRLFVAIPLPQTVMQQLALLQGGIPGARWVSHDQYHLTLRFIGEVDGHRMADIRNVLGSVHLAPFQLRLEGVDAFTNRGKAHTIWVGVARSQALMDLQKRVDTALRSVGVADQERKYRPHVTLARLRDAAPDRVAHYLSTHATFVTPPFEVAGFHLYLSHLGHSGAIHEVIASYPDDDAHIFGEFDDSETAKELYSAFDNNDFEQNR